MKRFLLQPEAWIAVTCLLVGVGMIFYTEYIVLLSPIVTIANVVLLILQVRSVRRWNRLNLMMEAICSQTWSLRGIPLAYLVAYLNNLQSRPTMTGFSITEKRE
jgi:hypothetical protein